MKVLIGFSWQKYVLYIKFVGQQTDL